MGEIITFYSYKGGVGRTMALANVAVLLAQWRYKVLMVDWDLEAPGLEFYFTDFIKTEEIGQQAGIIELLSDTAGAGPRENHALTWRNFVREIRLQDKAAAPLHFLGAGKRDDNYFTKVNNLNVDLFYLEQNGGLLIEKLRSEWKHAYDFILIDSRTGITDIGSICTVQLPDILALFFTATEQGLKGVVKVAKRVNLERQNLPVDRFNLISLPIPARFDRKEERELSEQWLNRFTEKLTEIYEDWLPDAINPFNFLEKTYIPYVPYCSFGENLPVLKEGTNDPRGIGYAYETLSALLVHKLGLESVERLMRDRSGFVKSAAVTPWTTVFDNANPFYYGNPVPVELFLGRGWEMHHIVNRIIANGQSSAIIGGPRSGKTSLLQYLSDPSVRGQLYGTHAEHLLFRLLDAHKILRNQSDQAAFWQSALYPLEQHILSHPASSWAGLYQKCHENNFDGFWLEQLFLRIQQDELCLVLMLDEFDALLNHQEINGAELYGNMRSLASGTGALALVIASRQPLYKLNEFAQALSPTGSPFFNFISEIHSGPLSDEEATDLLDKDEGFFSENDRAFIVYMAGSHVFLLQAAASSLWEAYEREKEDPVSRWNITAEKLQDIARSTLESTWRLWTPEMRLVITVIALTETAVLKKHDISHQGLLGDIDDFRPELRALEKQGFIMEKRINSHGRRIRPALLLWWLADELARAIRNEQSFEQWLRGHAWDGLLSKKESLQLKELARIFKGGATELIHAAIDKLSDYET